jgi:hypothetical protein
MQSLNKSDKILIPFIDGKSVMDSQMKPRMYKTRSAFEKSFPGYGRHEEDIDLVEYTPVVHGEWKYERYTGMWPAGVKKQDYV